MIVCVCRRLNSAKVSAAISGGANTPACVLAHHGERFNCGRCRETIAEMIGENRPANENTQPVLAAAE
ncbi:(2Fe-2S)-binding protein [Aquisalinus flavus]|uniref:(2Fe-2S)-binding protein n=1 Tax=Aquisalinus flavus TaxID=1526572 RepID=UPI00165F5B60|nr:(2Fe-2S)-binding protein [Aquisalinus flavus]UNE48907.1 (2Fe-2S)-binding protein [Aquisalinus flavus]